jgi:hypothetical protein
MLANTLLDCYTHCTLLRSESLLALLLLLSLIAVVVRLLLIQFL